MNRNVFIDNLRGFNLINMILFHGIWDLVYIFGCDIKWFDSWIGVVWQIFIACTFVVIAGYCYGYSRNKLKHGLKVFIAGGIISLVTYIFMPENIIIFGVLTMLGSCMIIMVPTQKLLHKINAYIGFGVFLILFIMTYNISLGYIGIKSILSIDLPKRMYSNWISTFMGFPMDEFYSTDYFGIIPWFFLFVVGYYLKSIIDNLSLVKVINEAKEKCEDKGIHIKGRGPINWLGRHSLIVYMVHQPVVYGILALIFKIWGNM